MKIIESFLFSEDYEKELLLLKLQLSEKHIHEWVICENTFSHQGDHKGLIAKKIIEEDERFAPYINRITILEGNRLFDKVDKTKFADSLAFQCENWQRSLAYDYFIKHCNDDDWIVVHDVDEMLDFTDAAREKEFFEKLTKANDGLLNVPRLRYWFDFDNVYKVPYCSTLCTKKYLLKHKDETLSILKSRHNVFKEKPWENIVAFEYSSCYRAAAILRKLDTTAHTWYNASDLKQALRCNHKLIKPQNVKRWLRRNKYSFFEIIPLTKKNSPALVRENLSVYKTGNIDKNYKANRKKDYPELYSPQYLFILLSDKANTQKRWFKKKFRFLLRRLKLEKVVYG